jgi:putative transposase
MRRRSARRRAILSHGSTPLTPQHPDDHRRPRRHPAARLVDGAAARPACRRESLPSQAVGVVVERQVRPRRATDAIRLTLVALSRVIDWRHLLTVVNTETLIQWHRRGFRLFWRWKSKPRGRPRVPRRSAAVGRRDGEGEPHVGRGADCLGVAREVRDSRLAAHGPAMYAVRFRTQPRVRLPGVEYVRPKPCSVRARVRFLRDGDSRVQRALCLRGPGSGHATNPALERCRHPTGERTAQQFRIVVSGERSHRFVLHDNDSIFSENVDRTIEAMGLTVLKTPVRAPQANAFCERLIEARSAASVSTS